MLAATAVATAATELLFLGFISIRVLVQGFVLFSRYHGQLAHYARGVFLVRFLLLTFKEKKVTQKGGRQMAFTRQDQLFMFAYRTQYI